MQNLKLRITIHCGSEEGVPYFELPEQFETIEEAIEVGNDAIRAGDNVKIIRCIDLLWHDIIILRRCADDRWV